METAQTDFLIEKRLRELAPELSLRYRGDMVVYDYILERFRLVFPDYTDHSILHCMNVLNYSNLLLGDIVKDLTGQELYVYTMAVALHDVGMTLKHSDFPAYLEALGLSEADFPGQKPVDICRALHNEFSALFIRKHWKILDIPDEGYARAISAVARGHRKCDLLNEEEYPEQFFAAEGVPIRLPFLAAVLRLADEMDMAQDRSPLMLYEMEQVKEISLISYHEHEKIRTITDITLMDGIIGIHSNTGDAQIRQRLMEYGEELQRKLEYCAEVVRQRSSFCLPCRMVELSFPDTSFRFVPKEI